MKLLMPGEVSWKVIAVVCGSVLLALCAAETRTASEVGQKKGSAHLQQEEWKGADSGIQAPRTVVVRTAKDWQALWQEHSRNRSNFTPLPSVDFDRSMVVAAFSGTKPTGGYSLEIVAVHASTHSVIVDYREKEPSPKAFVVQVLTQTYAIRVIPKTDLPITFHRLP